MTHGPEDSPFINRPDGQIPPTPPHPPAPPAAPSDIPAASDAAPPAKPIDTSWGAINQEPVPVPASIRRPTAADNTPAPSNVAGIKDTVESIIIALIFALTFRAFLVEAFVIPTASMAPTLMGAHARVVCPKCGYVFDQNVALDYYYDSQGRPLINSTRDLFSSTPFLTTRDGYPEPDEGGSQIRRCPNCGYRIDGRDLPEYTKTIAPTNQASPEYFAWTNNGDRILVMKYLYSFINPKRWDVIVFKEPVTARDNYIKRLIGLPGETVELIGGDVFIRPANAPAGTPEYIQRKPNDVQNAVWQLVYDNDHYPTDEGKPRPWEIDQRDGRSYIMSKSIAWHTPWTGEGDTAASWLTHSPIIEYHGTAPGTLRFAPPVNNPDESFYFKNITGYNNDLDSQDRLMVPDLHLECAWSPSTVAPVALTLGVAANRFRATIDTAGSLHLDQSAPQHADWNPINLHQAAVVIDQPLKALEANRTYRVAFNNVDHQIQLVVDGSVVLQYTPVWTDAQQHAMLDFIPHDEIPLVQINVDAACTLTHVKLMRDLYYTDTAGNYPTRATDGKPETIGRDEYFALGDNSVESLDSRLWSGVDLSLYDLPVWKDYRPGHIPKRFMLGKAFFVYWPSGYRPIDALPYPIIPDVGRMRMIR